jgi:hypothetical protein
MTNRNALLAHVKMYRRLFAQTNDMTFYRLMRETQKNLASTR